MAAVLLALAGAFAYGLSDFVGGLASRRTTAWAVAFTCTIGALAGSILLALLRAGHPEPADFAWAALAGVGTGLGSGFLYRGLSLGRMGVVAPISAVCAAVLPVVVGVAGGERPALLVWCGIVLALPAIWLVSREPGGMRSTAGVLDGVAAGLGFGMVFVGLGQVPHAAGYWPLVLVQVIGAVAIVACAAALRASWVPRDGIAWWGLLAGVLAALAVLMFLLARERGLLAVSAVLTSLYPAATVLLAAALLRERILRAQAAGLALCVAAVVCVALG